jgi:glycerophosphoryl diester phosphodiesterase
VPTLEEFLDALAPSGGRAIVELKGEWDAAAVGSAVADVTARDLEDRVALASFDARTLALAAAASDVVSRLLILKHVPTDVVSAVAEAGARGVVVSRKAVLARPEIVDQLHAADARVVVYTLNRDAHWDAVTALGVDGIVTDDPHTLSEWQRAYAGSD